MAIEKLVIDGVTFDTDGLSGFATVTNLFVLWEGPAVRGADRLIPGAAGVRAYRRRATVTKKTLELVIYGDNDATGTPHADKREGLEENVFYLRANLTDPTVAGDGTRTATLYLPSGATKTGDVHVEAFELGGDLGPLAVRATLDLSIPAGALS